MRILLVEDDASLSEAVRRLLHQEGHVVDVADSLRMAKAAITNHPYEVVLLDRMLPDGEGTALIFHARDAGVRTRFLILSALGDIQERVEGLDLGADDYVVKPFEPDELRARIRAVGAGRPAKVQARSNSAICVWTGPPATSSQPPTVRPRVGRWFCRAGS